MLVKELKDTPLKLFKIESGLGYFIAVKDCIRYEVIVDFRDLITSNHENITLGEMFGGKNIKWFDSKKI